ncbi:unnamed protein product [Orchesella dallaii]|uniref:Gustatory receptor n=1 Tax=Orchesella dallaii TaxID=48710 RepID=A0ABP1Q7W4_9HEXA
MHTITQKNGNIFVIQLFGYIILTLLDKYSYIIHKIWVTPPIRWISHLRRLKVRQNVKEVLPWMIIQFAHVLHVIYSTLLITGYGGKPVEELASGFKTVLAFQTSVDVAIAALTFTLWKKRDLIAACFNSTNQLPKRQSEVTFEKRLADKKGVYFFSHLFSSMVILELVLAPYALSLVIFIFNLDDPVHYFLELCGLAQTYWINKLVYTTISTVIQINRFLSTYTYFFLVIMLANRCLLVQLTILQPPNPEMIPIGLQRSFIGTFDLKLIVYRRLHLIFKYLNEMGSVTHSLMMTIAFLTLAVAGSVVILGTSYLSIPSHLFPLFPAYVISILGLLLVALPIGANIYENSVWFRYAWMKAGGYERKYVRKQLASCMALKAEVGAMGFIDKSYIMTYSDALLNNIVNVVMYVTETYPKVM